VELNEKRPGHLAIYQFPESAAQALAALDRYRRWRERPAGEVRQFPAQKASAAEILAKARESGERHLSPAEAFHLLDAYGIPVAAWHTAPDLEKLKSQQREFQYPAVLKAVAPDIIHKTEVGGVAVDLRNPEELIGAAQKMAESLAHAPTPGAANHPPGFLVQEYVRGGREVIIGMTHDANYGPLVMFGLGGVYVETFKDVVFRVPPLTDVDAREMIRQIRGYRLLEGVRGEPPVDFEALAEMLQRFSQMVEDLPLLAEIEINPFLVFPRAEDFRAVDVRVRLADASVTNSPPAKPSA
jgi:acyl-CoA synthetase (NDP forming)